MRHAEYSITLVCSGSERSRFLVSTKRLHNECNRGNQFFLGFLSNAPAQLRKICIVSNGFHVSK